MEIRPLTSELLDAFDPFARRTPDLRWCWCQWWRMRSSDFSDAKVPELRQRLRAQAEAATLVTGAPATPGGAPAPGLVAMDGDVAIGWVSLAPRAEFERLERSRVIPRIDDRPAWSIVCFAVAPDRRGEGVGARLLDAAVAYAADHGARLVEAYPIDVAGGAASAGAAFTGTRAMFERAGFRLAATTASRSSGVPRVVMRRELPTQRAQGELLALTDEVGLTGPEATP